METPDVDYILLLADGFYQRGQSSAQAAKEIVKDLGGKAFFIIVKGSVV